VAQPDPSRADVGLAGQARLTGALPVSRPSPAQVRRRGDRDTALALGVAYARRKTFGRRVTAERLPCF
jgi:hypothetical protein